MIEFKLALRRWILGWRLWDWISDGLGLDGDLRRMAARDEHMLERIVRLETWLTTVDAVVFRLENPEHLDAGVTLPEAASSAEQIRAEVASLKASFPTDLGDLANGSAAAKRPE